ncbi:MAG: F0F1 ATP synthase subunit alpha, partial [Duncaniella sp.]|nr:F0F1 ATP synthase subunit alpha [Duncaniella sp.]
RELDSFTKFGGDIDPVTARVIDKGRKNERLLIQPQYSPMEVEDEVAVIFCGTRGLLENVPLDKVAEFEKLFLQLVHAKYPQAIEEIGKGNLSDEVAKNLTDAASEISARYN